jgi:hypothetical protein
MFPAVVTAILLALFTFGNPLPGYSADLAQSSGAGSHQLMAQESSSSASAETAPATTEAPSDSEVNSAVEARIKELHNRLHITAAQQTQWDNLVEVMRDNAKAMIDLQKERAKDVKSMNAVDAVKSYAEVIQAHETGMNKFVPAFESLYNSMSDSQKKIADSMFRRKVRSATKKESPETRKEG